MFWPWFKTDTRIEALHGREQSHMAGRPKTGDEIVLLHALTTQEPCACRRAAQASRNRGRTHADVILLLFLHSPRLSSSQRRAKRAKAIGFITLKHPVGPSNVLGNQSLQVF
jgi:hypothetical protein